MRSEIKMLRDVGVSYGIVRSSIFATSQQTGRARVVYLKIISCAMNGLVKRRSDEETSTFVY